jgi:hypothetical protein
VRPAGFTIPKTRSYADAVHEFTRADAPVTAK